MGSFELFSLRGLTSSKGGRGAGEQSGKQMNTEGPPNGPWLPYQTNPKESRLWACWPPLGLTFFGPTRSCTLWAGFPLIRWSKGSLKKQSRL